jgi:hypothetical protein
MEDAIGPGMKDALGLVSHFFLNFQKAYSNQGQGRKKKEKEKGWTNFCFYIWRE